MKNMKLLKNKGFTLVECVIAVAVFAVITIMVLMIMASTVQTQKKATDAEEDLNNLVQNVVEDETNKKYGDDTKTLMMKMKSVSGSSDLGFSMTYNTIDGYKNYVRCPNAECGNIHNHTEFMSQAYLSAAYNDDVNKAAVSNDNSYIQHDASYWFDPTGMSYVCPDCGNIFVDTLECTACGKVDSADKFSYDRFKGAYFCPDCGNGNVSQKGLLQTVSADSEFRVSGMAANGIRYGTVEQPKVDDAKKYMALTGVSDDSFKATIKYTPNTNVSVPGRYRITFQNLQLNETEFGKLIVYLPPCYECKITGTSTNCNGLDDNAIPGLKPSANIQDYTKKSVLYIENLTKSNVGTASFWIEFTLTNYESNNSFDYDYSDKDTGGDCKLAGFWFCGHNMETYPR